MPRLLRRWVIPLLTLMLALGYALFGGRGREEGRLIDADGRRVFVADGDTLRIGTETVRLAEMDAVERAQFCLDAQGNRWSCGQTALAAMTAQVARGDLRCTTIERDRYGRTVARCTVAGKDDIGSAMVAAGWAVADGKRYATAQQSARDAKRGLWAGTFDLPKLWRERHHVEPRQVRN